MRKNTLIAAAIGGGTGVLLSIWANYLGLPWYIKIPAYLLMGTIIGLIPLTRK